MNYYTYIMASSKYGTLYIGMTNDLIRRVWEHKNHCVDGFTGRYDVTDLVWYEIHSTAENAIKREKRLKRYLRQWKISLIEENNPQWHDLYDDIAKP
jgi:putative endonuclease